MLLGKISKFFGNLKDDRSGNAMLLMALGMPILIGTSGMAVDFSQWYMWKRELQYATDQAAIAGAWAKADALSASDYQSRATQEFNANLSMLTGKTSNPTVGLADYGSGTNNSVSVTATTTAQTLPFSNILVNRSVSVGASAQATFEAATNYVVCMLAVDKTAVKGFIVGGNLNGNVTCGGGTLATSPTAITKNGNSSARFGYFVSGGGIDSGLSGNGTLNANISNLSDPYEGLTPPVDATTRVYDCPTSSTSTTTPSSSKKATVTTVTTTDYFYYQARNQQKAEEQQAAGTQESINYTGAGSKTNTSSTSTLNDQDVDSGIVEGTTQKTTSFNDWTGDVFAATGNEEVYEWKKVTATKTYTNVTTAGGSGTGTTVDTGSYTIYPGTYAGITIDCDTYFSPGVYTINGTLDFGTNFKVTGSDVMIVLQGSGTEKMKINNGSDIALSGITKATLMDTYGLTDEAASKLATMVLFDTTSTADLNMNGHATIAIDGTVYMPKRNGKFNGNSTVAGSCMILALATLEFTGTNSLGSFCLPTGASGITIGGTTVQVRLVA